MARDVIPIRGSAEEHERWKVAAGSQPFSAWARQVLNEAAEAAVAVARDRDYRRQERLEQIEATTPGVIRAVAVGGPKPFRPDFKK